MRSIFTVILAFLVAIPPVSAQINEQKIRNLISRCDVADTVLKASTHEQFWQLLQMSNKPYRKTVKSLRSGGDRDIKRELIQALSNSDAYFTTVPTRNLLYDRCETMISASGIRSVNPLATLTITDEHDIAAFGYPNGYIFITGALYDAVDGDSLILQSLLAAEEAHYALQHAYAHAKAEKQRRKRHRFWKIFGAAAITGASIVADQATEGIFPAELGITAATLVAISDTPQRYKMDYTPEQIVEADIIAYRYMDLDGNGHAYIDALRHIGYDLDASSGYYGKDYLSVADRIAILEYIADNPRPRNIKANKAGLKPVPAHTDIFAPSNYR